MSPSIEETTLATANSPVGPEPVFDPGIPQHDLRLLRLPKAFLVPAGSPAPRWRRYTGTGFGEILKAIFNLQVIAVLALVLLTIVVGASTGGHQIVYAPLAVGIGDAVGIVWLVRKGLSEPPGHRAARVHHGRYFTPADFDPESKELLTRAQLACRTVLEAEASKQGLLDTIDNAVTLPRVLWETAEMLRSQTVLRAEQRAARSGVVTPELAAVLAPQREALSRSVTAVKERIGRLETYARHVQEADAAFRARVLLESNDKYRELLAKTGDETALASLSERAKILEETLARSVQEAVDSGRTLAL